MRMSCNGCRVLRKGCSDNCSIRPCLHWIKSPDSQAHATVFLAKFYGRAGLMNLINAGPDHLRPAIFRSLLYEACGRIVNPIYGSVGLLWSGQWQLCQNAVEAVLKGAPITPISSEAAATSAPPPPSSSSAKAYDIRHVTKDQSSNCNSHFPDLHRTRFKRSRVANPTSKASSAHKAAAAAAFSKMMSPATPDELTRNVDAAELNGSTTSHDSSVSHPVDEVTTDTSNLSVETAEADVEGRHNGCDGDGDGELELDLTLGFGLGFEPVQRSRSSQPKSCTASRAADDGACRIQLGLF